MIDNFEVCLPKKYRPTLKKLAKELNISMRKLIEMILVMYIEEFNEQLKELTD